MIQIQVGSLYQSSQLLEIIPFQYSQTLCHIEQYTCIIENIHLTYESHPINRISKKLTKLKIIYGLPNKVDFNVKKRLMYRPGLILEMYRQFLKPTKLVIIRSIFNLTLLYSLHVPKVLNPVGRLGLLCLISCNNTNPIR